jgi:hypothetical protein
LLPLLRTYPLSSLYSSPLSALPCAPRLFPLFPLLLTYSLASLYSLSSL